MKRHAFLLLALACLPAAAQTSAPVPLAAIAFSVTETDEPGLERTLRSGLSSTDPKLRAAAARVVNVRRVLPLLDHVRVCLDRERDGDAAREEARTAVMLGGARDVARAFFASERFGHHLDAVTAAAASRLGAESTRIYFDELKQRDIDEVDFFRNALWGRTQDASALAAQLLAAKKTDAFGSLLFALRGEPRDVLDFNVLSGALQSTDQDETAKVAATWYVVSHGAAASTSLDPRLKPVATAMTINDGDAEGFVARELLRRLLGLSKTATAEFRFALAQSRMAQLRIALAPRRISKFLTADEKRLVFTDADPQEAPAEQPVPFTLPSPLPNGIAQAVMTATSCNAGWSGKASVTADFSGRVTAADLSKISTTPACQRALDTLIRLSIVDNDYISAPFENRDVTLVHARDSSPCFDEGPQATRAGYVIGRHAFRFPRLIKSVNPEVPANTKHGEVVVDTVVSPTGCVRAVHLVKGTGNASVDTATLSAVSQWTFQPGGYDQIPVEWTVELHVDVGK